MHRQCIYQTMYILGRKSANKLFFIATKGSQAPWKKDYSQEVLTKIFKTYKTRRVKILEIQEQKHKFLFSRKQLTKILYLLGLTASTHSGGRVWMGLAVRILVLHSLSNTRVKGRSEGQADKFRVVLGLLILMRDPGQAGGEKEMLTP